MEEPPIKSYRQLMGEKYGSKNASKKKETPKPPKKEGNNEVFTSYFEDEDYILEQIKTEDVAVGADSEKGTPGTAFLAYSKLDGKTEVINDYEYHGRLIRPIVDDILLKNGILLPTGVEEYKNTKEITDDIYKYFSKNVEVPAFFEKFLPHLVLFYWVYEKFPFIPYVQFVGGTGTGKSTAMEIFGSVCYKSIETTGSLTIASMFRVATAWKGTLLIDEYDKVGENAKEITLFLKAGVSNKLIIRTEGEKTKQLRAYIVKAPKLFTSETPISDAGLQSRTIVIKMEKNTRRIPLYRLQDDLEEAQKIRNKLLLWRFRNLNKIDLKDIRFGFKELQAFDARVQQIITPVYYFSDDATRKDILNFAEEQQEETLLSRRESLDGIIFEMLLNIWENGEEVQIKVITARLNEDQKARGYKRELTEKRVSNMIRKVLGYETERRGHDRTAWVVRNDDVTKNKKSYYGIGGVLDLPTAPTAPTAVASKQGKNAEGSGENAEGTDETIQEIFET